MDTTGTSPNGSHSDTYVAFDIISQDRFYNSPDREGIHQGPAASPVEGNDYKSPWDIDPDSRYQTPKKSATCVDQVPSQLRDSSSTEPFSSAATTTTTQQSRVIPELQYLDSAPGLATASREDAAPTPTIDPSSLLENSSKAFIRDASMSSLSNVFSASLAPRALRRMPSMQDLRAHHIDEAKSVNVSGPRLAPSSSFRLANATPSSYIGHEQYSGSSATSDMSRARFCTTNPSCFVDTDPGLCVGNYDCSDSNYGHEHDSKIGFDPNLKSAFDWSSDEEDNREGFKRRIRRLKKVLLV